MMSYFITMRHTHVTILDIDLLIYQFSNLSVTFFSSMVSALFF